MSTNLVIIPTYNEKENISKIIAAVFALPVAFDLLVIDDGSPDGTAEIVRNLIPLHQNRLFLECRTGKLGLGTAYIHGFGWALGRSYEYIFEMDADFSHNPSDLPRLLAACQADKVGVAVGSRYIKGGKLHNWPFKRRFMSRGASIYVQCATGMLVKDPTAGFVCYKRAFLQRLDFAKIGFVDRRAHV